jgi:hypothetical protein
MYKFFKALQININNLYLKILKQFILLEMKLYLNKEIQQIHFILCLQDKFEFKFLKSNQLF